MNRFERIAFTVISEEKDDLIKPKTILKSTSFPQTVSIEFRAGFVGLKPLHRYYFNVNISPFHLKVNVGDEINIIESYTESAKMYIDTKGGNADSEVDGQITVKLDKIMLISKGTYHLESNLIDGDGDDEVILHTNSTYFSVE